MKLTNDTVVVYNNVIGTFQSLKLMGATEMNCVVAKGNDFLRHKKLN